MRPTIEDKRSRCMCIGDRPIVKYKGNVMLEKGKESLSIPSDNKRKAIRAKRKKKR